jgi:putative two-component system response regulator
LVAGGLRKAALPRILIVDDDRTTVSLLQTLLEMDGFDVVTAVNGQMALHTADSAPPDVFLVDYHLSDMDGIELVGHLRSDSRFAQTPIVMASGLDKGDEALAVGANAFLIKPFEPDELVNLFFNLLG